MPRALHIRRTVRFASVVAAAGALISAASLASGSPAGPRLQTLARIVTFRWAAEHPLNATSIGLTHYDGALDHPSRAQLRHDLALILRWKRELASVSLDGATLAERDDALLIRAQLIGMERQFTVYRSYEKDYAGPTSAVVGALFTQFEYLPVVGRDGATKSDVAVAWRHIVERMQKAPSYIAAGERLVTHPGRLYGVVGLQMLDGMPSFLNGALTDAAKKQVGAAELPAFIRARDELVRSASQAARYIRSHVESWPENYAIGRAAYDAMLRDEQLLPYTADDVQRFGADELAHGWAVQIWMQNQAKAHGTPIGPESGGGIAPSGGALVDYYRDRISELTRWMIDHDVVTIPRWLGEVRVIETPSFLLPVSPGASMSSPRLFSPETTGYYYIAPATDIKQAAARLDANEDFDRDRIWSTGAHEVMPGHFLQLSIARRHPDFVRRVTGSGVFAEGWAYYGEELFVQLGLYGDDLDPRYYTAQWERVRGARAIVDAKLASGEWSYDRAAGFFARETGFTPTAAKAAVAGIALGPGYVIAYTVGRLQLENVLAEYWRHMGGKGSLHDFHDRLLSYGNEPFAVVGPELLADLRKPASAVRAAAHY